MKRERPRGGRQSRPGKSVTGRWFGQEGGRSRRNGLPAMWLPDTERSVGNLADSKCGWGGPCNPASRGSSSCHASNAERVLRLNPPRGGFGTRELEGGHWLAVTDRPRDAAVSRPSDATVTNKKMGSAAFDSPDRRVQRNESALMDGCSPARIVSLDKAKLDMPFCRIEGSLRRGEKKRVSGPPPQPSMPAVRQAILDRLSRPPPGQCPQCGCSLPSAIPSLLPK